MFNEEIIFHLKRVGAEMHMRTSDFYRYEHYILTEGRNFRTFLKENYANALDSCYVLAKKMLNMELNIMF